MFLLPFWRVNLPPEALQFGNTLEIIHYEKGAAISKELIHQENPKFQTVMNYLNSNQMNWKYDIASYAPSILIKGNGITLNCHQRNAIIYYTNSEGNSVQFSSDAQEISFCGLPLKAP